MPNIKQILTKEFFFNIYQYQPLSHFPCHYHKVHYCVHCKTDILLFSMVFSLGRSNYIINIADINNDLKINNLRIIFTFRIPIYIFSRLAWSNQAIEMVLLQQY